MKHTLIALVLFFAICFPAFSQKKESAPPDFAAIEKNIADKNSPFYYPALMKRYKESDTTLTTEEYRHLYYGFSFRDEYSPYGRSDLSKDVSVLFKKEELSDDDIDQVIKLEKKILEEYPFNLQDIYTLVRMYERKKDAAAVAVEEKKLTGLGKAIISTGDGRTDTTALFVISVDHEYDLIGLFGFRFGGRQSLIHSSQGETDRLELEKNDDGIEALYFNVDRLFASMQKIFDKK